MNVPVLCLLGFAGWALLLVGAIGIVRVGKVLRREVPPNGFPSGTKHGTEAYWRLNRAHMNTLENLPIFATVVLAAAVVGVQGPMLDQLAMTTLGARIGQSSVHVAGGTNLHINARFTFFLVQIVCLLWMGVLVASAIL
jgi:uncharacterized MAPEG superfamily protein